MKKLYYLIPACLLLSIQVNAQQVDDSSLYEMSLAELMEIPVVTASQSKQKANDAPATIYVITEEQIRDRGYSSLEELLEDIPEIEIQRKSVAETSNYFTFRGISGNEKFMILMDGVRINSMAATSHAIGYNYPLINAKRVEVILGPASSLYGVDAFSGIINIITRTGSELSGMEMRSSVGLYNTYDNSFVAGFGKDDMSFTLSGSQYHSAEPHFPDYYKEDFKWYNEIYKKEGTVRLGPFAPDVTIPTGEPLPFEMPTNAYTIHAGAKLGNLDVAYSRRFESHNTSSGMRPEYNVYRRDAVYETLIESYHANHLYSTNDGKLSFQTTLSLGSFELTPESNFVNTFTGYRQGYKYEFHRSFTFQEQVTYIINEKSSIIGGVSLQDVTALAKTGDLPFKYDKKVPSDLQQMYYIGTNTKDMNGEDLTIYQDFYNVEQKNIGSFLQYQNRFNDKVSLTLGSRYDYNTRYGPSINPRAGLVLTPITNMKLKLLYGEAFLAPSIYKAFQHYGGFITVDADGSPTGDPSETTGLFGTFWHLTNPDLRPEKVRSSEFGFSYFKDKIGLSFDAYHNLISNLIVPELQFGQTFKGVEVGAVERVVNQGVANTYGFTVKMDVQHNIGGVKLLGYAAYSYSNGDIEGGNLPFSAQHTIKSGLQVKYKKFSMNPRLIYRSGTFHPYGDENGNLFKTDQFVLINFFSRYQVSKNFDINLKVRNLLDARYYNASLAFGEGFAATPQDPIRVDFGIRLRL
jgi:outer membrane receptor for ferrienterochelin and colicin